MCAAMPTVASQYITRTAAAGVCFNAWFLLAFTTVLTRDPDLRTSIPYVTRLLTEQAAEKIFRGARATLGGENFTVAEFFRRCDRVMAHSALRAMHEGEHFVYPDHDSAFRWDEYLRFDTRAKSLPAHVTADTLCMAMRDAKLACVADLLTVGVDVTKLGTICDLGGGQHVDELDQEEIEEAVNAPALAEIAAPSVLQTIAEPTDVRPVHNTRPDHSRALQDISDTTAPDNNVRTQ